MLDLGAVFSALWRNAWLLALSALIGLMLALAFLKLATTPLYRASATVLLGAQSTGTLDVGNVASRSAFDSAAIQTELAVIRSNTVLLDVVKQLDLLEDPNFNPVLSLTPEQTAGMSPEKLQIQAELQTVNTLSRVISVGNISGTYLLEISAMTTSPERSQQIANTLVDVYQQSDIDRKFQASTAAASWLSSRLDELREQLTEAEAKIEAFELSPPGTPERYADAVRLERLAVDAEAIRELYESFLTRLRETSVQASNQQPNSYVLTYAHVPLEPAAPRGKVILFFGMVFGGLIGLGLVLLRETLSNKLHRPADVERATGYPLVGMTGRLRNRRNLLWQRGEVGMKNPRYAAAIEELRVNLLMLSHLNGAPKLVGVTSSLPADGKTELVMSLAESFALSGKRVLLIDTDLRQRGLSTRLTPETQSGLLRLVQANGKGFETAVVSQVATGIDVLPCEEPCAAPVDLLLSEAFGEILNIAKDRYDIVLLDNSPVLAVPDSGIVGRAIRSAAPKNSALLFVVRNGRSDAAQISEAVSRLHRAGVEPDGLVMTQMPKSASQAKYGPKLTALPRTE
ncbi:MAG: Wzz/FepE/Etk N-terminal domain-containing protein [Mangrovicoccus sp.]|nr:Wzz/FepE/Etk N-terminal domain-containing protein [Mangrovicoccus sp.]